MISSLSNSIGNLLNNSTDSSSEGTSEHSQSEDATSQRSNHSSNSSILNWSSLQWSSISPSTLFHNLTFSNPFRRRNSRSPSTSSSSSQLHQHTYNYTYDKPLAHFLNGTLIRSTKPREFIELANFGNKVVEVDDGERGVGHDFKPFHLETPTWCDSCGEFIWTPFVCDDRVSTRSSLGMPDFAQYVQCHNCRYTCHLRCHTFVRIDCQGVKETETPYLVTLKSRPPSPLFRETTTFKTKIERFNEKRKSKGSGLGLTIIDETKHAFRGFLRVHLNLTRPINVISGRRPPSIYDIINEEEANNSIKRRTLTSFYMPRDTVKNIHITSENTSLEVIKSMLKKFKVVDNPQKFALYLRSTDPVSHVNVLKRLADQDKPLRIQLEHDDDEGDEEKEFVLQENDNTDIAWDAFEVPELKNFLKILEKEEKEHLDQVIEKYNSLKDVIRKILKAECGDCES